MEKDQNIRVVELFAGVGGFRVGFERCSSRFKTVWAISGNPAKAASGHINAIAKILETKRTAAMMI